MKKTINLSTSALIMAAIICSASCKKCIDMAPPASDSLNVFVAGYDYDPIAQAIIAVYWKNGSEVVLSNKSGNAEANSIFLSGADIYVAGYQVNSEGVGVAVYWKNGAAVSLTDGTHSAIATSIAVEGTDVYVSGYENNGKVYVAKYWKNGTVFPLTDSIHNAYATSIAVSGNDVYVSGYEYNGARNPYSVLLHSEDPVMYPDILNPVAKFWKNSHQVLLTDGTEFARSFSVVLSGSDVYVAGEENTGIDPNTTSIAKYWKNSNPVLLTQNSQGNANATSMFFSGSDIYVAGYQSNGVYYYAEYWKNGNLALLTPQASTHTGVTNSIAVAGTDVYVAGYESPDGYHSRAEYWKNGNVVYLSAPNMPYQSANSILVK